jgi:serine/threonine protein kinase/tetratricopeptide (TPR) repeat protein
MTSEQWTSVRRLLDDALDNPEVRPALMAKLRDRDPQMCNELERLIADAESVDEGSDDPGPLALDFCGQTIGPYTIVREIGRGGSGTVVLASREEAGARLEVALKFLQKDFLRGAPRRTFQRELRALTRLDHPNIARLRDWGTVPGGLLYLAIEFVDGQTITQYCAQKRAGLADRLALFQQVCEAVEHAHRNLVVHRDLKPSNILVTRDGQVKLLDFGIAAELDAATDSTTLMQRSLTPAYASPEQIAGRPVSVATDVYSLGLALYELLAGRLPHSHETGKFWAAGVDEPAPPSRCASLAEVSAREIAGDLDGIVLKAIQKESERRYPSVEQFASDLRRYREGRPVWARRSSRLYVASRFWRRNRLRVAVASLALMALASTAGIAVWKWRDADRNLAEEKRDYRELRAFAEAVISSVDAGTVTSPTEAQRRMSETVARSLDRLSKGRQNDEELQLQIAAAYIQLGMAEGANTYPNQGDSNAAWVNFRKAYQICLQQWRARADRNSGVRLLMAAREIGRLQADPAPAAAFLLSGIDATRELIARYPKDMEILRAFADAYGVLAQRLRSTGDLAGASANFRRAIELADRALALDPTDVGSLIHKEGYTGELGNTLRIEGHFEEALADQTQALQIARRAVELKPSNHARREAAFKQTGRCEALRELKRYPEALRDVREALATLQTLSRQDPSDDQAKSDLSLAYYRQGSVEFSQGHTAEALASHREALRLRREQYARHQSNPQAVRNYQNSLTRFGEVLLAARNDASVQADLNTAIEISNELLKQTPSDVYAAADLARLYRDKATWAARAGRRAEVDRLLRQSVSLWHDVCKRAPLDVLLAGEAQNCERILERSRTDPPL